METKNSSLLTRLENFSFNDPDSTFSFADRLSKENGWTPHYTIRVLAEYKRFLFLAAEAGHPVSPSDAIDQAWHLHLTYTQSYWKDLCGEVLKKPLHHHPTKGGATESAKFADWYQRTCESYEKLFGHAPPKDIWPQPASHGHPDYARVDRNRNWVVPKPQLRLEAWRILAGAVLLTFVAGCSTAFVAQGSIFDMRGPSFLLFYVVSAAAVFSIAVILRKSMRLPDGRPELSRLPSDPYVIAALAGGPTQVVNTAIANLVQHGALRFKEGARPPELKAGKPMDIPAHAIEKEVYLTCVRGTTKLPEVRKEVQNLIGAVDGQLEREGWLVGNLQANKARFIPLLVCAILPLVGIIKIMIGQARHKPVGFLILLVVVTVLAALIGFARRPRRSLAGDKVLEALRSKHAALQYSNRLCPSDGISPVLPLAVAVFGLGVLAATPYSSLERQLKPPVGTDGCGGGSGCGGGDGGGGCGGGCGGCGGGD